MAGSSMAEELNQREQHAVQVILSTLAESWEAGDGVRFASVFAPDADFINIVGMHAKGRGRIAAHAGQLFTGVYAGSRLTLEATDTRKLSADIAHVIVGSSLHLPDGPRAGENRSIANFVLARTADGWEIAAFHNTPIVRASSS